MPLWLTEPRWPLTVLLDANVRNGRRASILPFAKGMAYKNNVFYQVIDQILQV